MKRLRRRTRPFKHTVKKLSREIWFGLEKEWKIWRVKCKLEEIKARRQRDGCKELSIKCGFKKETRPLLIEFMLNKYIPRIIKTKEAKLQTEEREIELSVAVPLFRAKYCAWLAFEGLSRQTGVDFAWELIVAEEVNDESFGESEVMKYKERLKRVGCVRLKYIALEKWIPLSKKFKLLVKNCTPTSRIFATCAADIFPPPKRLKTQHDIFFNDLEIDWCASGMTIVYDIATEKTYIHDVTSIRNNIKNDGSNRAIKMDIMRNLPETDVAKSVDGWIWSAANNYVKLQGKKFKPYLDISTNWKYGLNVNGLNNLSLGRYKKFNDGFIESSPRHRKCLLDINKTIPQDIMKRLKEAKKYLKLHKRGLPKY